MTWAPRLAPQPPHGLWPAALLLWLAQPAAALETTTLGEAYLFGQSQSLYADAPFNPDNRFLGLPKDGARAETRLELRGAGDELDFKLRVRGVAGRYDCDCDERSYSDLYASQAYLRWRLSPSTSVNLGRQLLTWGPASFRFPSNPFYFDAGRTEPLRELAGLDVVGVSTHRGNWSLHATQIFSSGHVGGTEGEDFSGSQIGSTRYRRTSLVRLEMQREAWNLGLVGANQQSGAGFVGGYTAYDLNDAWRVWSEAGWGKRPWSIAADVDGAAYAVTSPSASAATLLVGAGYTLLNGQSVQLEYLYDGHGLSLGEERTYFDTAIRASAELDGPLAGQAAATLGQGLRYVPVSLSRRYLAAAWQSSPQDSRFFWRAMWTYNVTDRSHQPSVFAEYSFSERASWTLNFVFNHGSRRSEYGSLLRNSLTVGLKINLF